MLTKFVICQKHARFAYNDRTQRLSLMLDSIHSSTDPLIEILSNVKASCMSGTLFTTRSHFSMFLYPGPPGMWASPPHNRIVHTEGII